MKALGWDDKPEEYFNDLKAQLDAIGIELIIESDINRVATLLDQIRSEQWDLVITDIFDEVNTPAGERLPYGIEIAQQALKYDLPVYAVTKERTSRNLKRIPDGVPIISKSTPWGFAALNIKSDLKRRGCWTSSKKVFLIYGHDRDAEDATARVRAELMNWRLEPCVISASTITATIAMELVNEMHDATAIVAICTPDDEVTLREGVLLVPPATSRSYRQPRQNVLLEIGMAMGLNRGLRKLTFLQRWDRDNPQLQAALPSDLGGVLTLRFESDITTIFPDLKVRLRKLGITIS
jgi:predicted nucleotide-binding protein